MAAGVPAGTAAVAKAWGVGGRSPGGGCGGWAKPLCVEVEYVSCALVVGSG